MIKYNHCLNRIGEKQIIKIITSALLIFTGSLSAIAITSVHTESVAQAATITFPAAIKDIFPDPALAEVIRQNLGRSSVNDLVLPLDLNTIQSLSAQNKGIQSIDDIEHLQYLRSITLANNQITNLDVFANTNFYLLTTISFGQNKINSIDGFATTNNPSLRTLDLGNNAIRSLQPLTTAKFPSIQFVYLANNVITSIDPLANANFPALTTLSLTVQTIQNNQLSYTEHLSLENQITSIDGNRVAPSSISHNGTYQEPHLEWELPAYTYEVTYNFNQAIIISGATATFSGIVKQPLSSLYTVTFNVLGETTSETVYANSWINEPVQPTLEGHTFIGWFDAQTDGTQWDFASDVMPSHDLTLYAQFIADDTNESTDNNLNTQTNLKIMILQLLKIILHPCYQQQDNQPWK